MSLKEKESGDILCDLMETAQIPPSAPRRRKLARRRVSIKNLSLENSELFKAAEDPWSCR